MTRKVKSLAFLLAACGQFTGWPVLGCGSRSRVSIPPGWRPTAAQIQKLESSVRLTDARNWNDREQLKLAGYVRYYAGSFAGNDQVIFGEFVDAAIARQAPGIHIASSRNEFPNIFDGGCSIMEVVYSVGKQRILSIACHGDA